MSDETQVIVITGAGGGMGIACITAFAERGQLLLVDFEEESLTRAQAAAAASGASAFGVRCDVTVATDVAALAGAIADTGRLRSLVHTAGISPVMATGRRVLEVDLVGTARVLDALEPLVSQGTAAVCIASIAGYSDIAAELDPLLDDPLIEGFLDTVEAQLGAPLAGDTGYVLAKRGVMRLCERLAKSWGERGGRTVSIAPGLVDTEMARLEFEQQEIMKIMSDITPVKRPGTSHLPGRPEDVAALAAFLCSDSASFISGCDIRCDGGLVGAGRHLGLGI